MKERLLDLLAERSFAIGDFTLASGAKSRYYVDARMTTFSADGQSLIGELALAVLDEARLKPDAVGGLTLGADPIACAIAHRASLAGRHIDAFSVRKKPKGHGRGRQVEGCFKPGSSVVVLEDVITTGGSALKACQVLEAEGAEILAVLALLDREEGGRESVEERGYSVLSIVRLSELRDRVGDG